MARIFSWAAARAALTALPAAAQESCPGAGPQAPRNFTRVEGTHKIVAAFAPSAREANLCNLLAHTNAEHKGMGLSTSAGVGANGGWKCRRT